MSSTEGGGGSVGGDKSSSSGNSASATGKPVTSAAGGCGQLTATAVLGGGGMSAVTTPIPIDLASASKVLVRPEKTTLPTTTYRFGSNAGSQMRVVIPSSAAPQTFYRQPASIKQDATTNRTQISAIPVARSVTQTTSLTVSRAPQTTPTTVSYHVSNRVSATPVVAANLQATARATTINGPIRISTPPIQVATNNTTTYVQRQPSTVVPARNPTSSASSSGSSPTAATIISQNSGQNNTTTLVPNFQMSTQLIRANSITAAGVAGGTVAGVAPRARVVTQTTLPANHHQVSMNTGSGGGSTVVSGVSSAVTGAGGSPQTIAIGAAGAGGGVTGVGASGHQATQPQAFVATLSAVLQAPRQVSTLVYTNNSNAQQYTIGTNQQRLALATTLSPQRPAQATTVTTGIRPTIQRLPTTAAGIRVNNGSLNFRPPVLASTTVLTTIASGGTGVVGTVTNSQQQQVQQVQTVQQIQQQQRTVTAAGVAAISNSIPARIIQVQNPQSGAAGTAQIVNGRIQNLLNIQPLIVSNNRLNQGALQPGLTIAQVGKLTPVATGPGSTGGSDGGGGSTTTTLQTASGQQIVVSTGGAGGTVVGGGAGGTSAAILAGSLITTNQSGAGGGVSQTSAHPGQITQIVNVNAPTVVSVATGGVGGSPQQQQQIVTVSQAGCGVSSTGATVIPIPLALTSARSVGGGVAAGHSPLSIVTGGIVRTAGGVGGAGVGTSISSVLPIAKVTPQQQQQQQGLVSIESNVGGGGALVTQHYSVAGGPGSSGGPSLYIQTRPQPGGTGATGTIIAAASTGGSALTSSAKGGATLSVVSSSSGHGAGVGGGGGGGVGGSATSATTFLPTSTFYYERLTSSPATSNNTNVPSSTASVSIASGAVSCSSSTVTFVQSASTPSSTTITTTSAISGPVFSIPSSSSVISSGVGAGSGNSTTVVTVAGSSNPSLTPYGSSGSFAIVQASAASLQSASSVAANAGRTPTALTSGPIHGIVPASIQGGGATVTGSIVSVSQQSSVAALAGSASSTTQIVPIRFHPQLIVDSSGQTQQIIVSGGAGTANIVPLIPVGAGVSRVGGNSNNNTTTTVVTTSKQQQQQHQQQQESPQSSILRKRALVESVSLKATPVGKDLTQALMVVEREQQQEAQLQLIQQQQQQHHHLVAELRDLTGRSSPLSHSRPPSTDGSTTVSATSSPGLDEQEEEEIRAQAYANRNSNAMSGGGHFKPVQGDMHYLQQQQQQQQQPQQHPNIREIISLHCTESFPTNLGASTTLTVVPIGNHAVVGASAGSRNGDNGGLYEQSPRKKARKQLLMPMSEGAASAGGGPAAGAALLKTGSSTASSSVSSATPAGGQQTLYLAEHHHGGEVHDERMAPSGSGIVVLGNISSAPSTPMVASHLVSNQGGGGMHSTQAPTGAATHLSHHVSKHSSISVSIAPSLAGPANLMHNSSVRMDPPSVSTSSSITVQQQGIVTVVAQKTNVALRKPTNVSLLQSYKQTWKAANNHFQRYTDVKQREERRPTVMDIANQSHILQKVNGWKIFHLSAQIEDMCDLESQAYSKLGQMLRSMESSSGASGSSSSVKPTTDIERINELLKGNMQRSKIIMDGINEARTQIMKIFKHKPHVSDIILRCASKRNFKKREKT